MDVYKMVTDKIIDELAKGTVPWVKPWVNTSGTSVAVSHNDGRVYSLLNQILLGMEGEYITFKQAESEGGRIKKGAKARKVVFFSMLEKDKTAKDGTVITGPDGEAARIQIPFLKYSNVFHLDDTEGITAKHVQSKGPVADNHPIEDAQKAADEYLQRSGVTLRHYEQDHSFYRPSTDEVVLPHMNQFENAESYYATLFHELAHSTGRSNRLNREQGSRFGDEKYSREELVAEIASAVLCNKFGIDTEKVFKNTAAYCENWLKALKGDSKMIVWAASRAEKAVRLILNEQDEGKGAAA